jgi:ComF family protein
VNSNLFQRVLASPLNLVYPVSCPLCGSDDPSCDEQETHLCSDCRRQLLPESESFCRFCGAVVGPYLSDDSRCHHCRNDRFTFSETAALGTYSGELRKAIRNCQQPGRSDLVRALVSLLWEAQAHRLKDWQIDLVTCIPQHWRKRLTRSINTSAELGARLAQKSDLPFARQLLSKTRHTPDQAQLTPTERRQNLKEAFRVSFRSLARGRRILLVDDVLTTGSTVEACARALKAAEASEIFVAVAGRGLG